MYVGLVHVQVTVCELPKPCVAEAEIPVPGMLKPTLMVVARAVLVEKKPFCECKLQSAGSAWAILVAAGVRKSLVRIWGR
jgi:hypothetical protein